MPRNFIGDPPFAPIVFFDHDRVFTNQDLAEFVVERPEGISICIRYPAGPANRGGYFFHFRRAGNDEFVLYDFERRFVKTFSAARLVAFINHCTGRVFDESSFVLCQTELNFLQDAESGA